MDTKQLERHLENLRPPAIAAGDHMRRSRCRLDSQLYAAQGAAARRSGFKRMPMILVIAVIPIHDAFMELWGLR